MENYTLTRDLLNHKAMKTKTFILIFIFITLVQSSCRDDDSKLGQQETQLIVKNSTESNLLNIKVFSISIDDLLPNSESNPYDFNFKRLEDDPFMSFEAKNTKFGIYLLPDSSKKKMVIVIDSLNFQTMHTYMHTE